MPRPEGQRCHGACNAGQAQNDKRVNESYYNLDVTPQSRAQTQVATGIAGDGTIYFTYKGLLRSVIPAFRTRQDGLAPTTLVIEAPARVVYREFAADWKIHNGPLCVFRSRSTRSAPGAERINEIAPNLIREYDQNIGTLAGKDSVAIITSNKLPMSVDIKTIAEGAAKVMKAGGQFRMGFQADIQTEVAHNSAARLRAAGLRQAAAQITLKPGGIPVPASGFVDAIR